MLEYAIYIPSAALEPSYAVWLTDAFMAEMSSSSRIQDVFTELRRRHIGPAYSKHLDAYSVYSSFSRAPLPNEHTLDDIGFVDGSHLHVYFRYRGGTDMGSHSMPGEFVEGSSGSPLAVHLMTIAYVAC